MQHIINFNFKILTMLQAYKITFVVAAGLSIILLGAASAMAQCSSSKIKIDHTSGTLSLGCTDVSVTSDGYASTFTSSPPCLFGPYRIGFQDISGSYTFTFSVPVQEVTLDVHSLNNQPGLGVEEMSIEVNGAFYPLTSPGSPAYCGLQAIIWPPGTLRAPVGPSTASSKDLIISGTIYSIRVANNVLENSPNGSVFSLYICCNACETDAGVINSGDIELCLGETATLPASSQVVLDANDLLQYIMFTNPNDPKASILATSNSPSFNFDPSTMVIGTTYYIAAIAGNALNGNVDSADPCWDISNAIEVIWWSTPTVVFASDEECFQAGGCYNIHISFTGTSPFHLIGQVVSGGNVISTVDKIYNTSLDVLEVCIPGITPYGQLTVEAVSLSDANCICD